MQKRKGNNQEQFLRGEENMSSRTYKIRMTFNSQRDIHSMARKMKIIGIYTYSV